MQSKLKQHLAIATGAATAGAVPIGADAAIVYKDETNAFSVSYQGPTSADWNIDASQDSDIDFRISSTYATFFTRKSYINISSAGGANGRGLIADAAGTRTESFRNLAEGVEVGPTLAAAYTWKGNGDLATRTLMDGASVGDDFDQGIIGSNFIGFRFLSGAAMHYGWAEVILSTDDGGTVTVNRWAYNDSPDGSVNVGQAPAPSTLALLAAGAFGIRRWRARRAA